MYASDIADQHYLRGVQETDTNGEVTFTTILPGCYSGRMTHMHFEVYAASCYSASFSNPARISYASDNVFSDGTSLQLATVSESVTAGYAASLEVALSA